jgi:hypothetical protein
MKRFLVVSLVSLAFSTFAPVAIADVVSAPPAACPEGGRPSTCHGGPHCRPLGCKTDADCLDGLVCQDRSFCVGVVNCAGNIPPDADPAMYNVQTVEITCASDDVCGAAGPCTSLKVCVLGSGSGSSSAGSNSSSTGNPPDMGTESSCDCRLGASTGRIGALALSFGTLMSLALRRRKRR